MLPSTLCCVIQDARGRYRVSAKESDIAQFPRHHRYVSFADAYRVMNRLNVPRADARRAAAAVLS